MGLLDLFKTNVEPKKLDTKKTFRNDVERDMYVNNIAGYRDLKDKLDYQDEFLARLNSAQEKYRENGDLDAVIKELESIFIESDPPCNTSHNMTLVDYYLKAGMRDKAWGYLNRLQYTNQAPLKEIRFAQARILKNEKKYADAIEMYMLAYLAKSEWNNTFQKNMFIKDIQSSANKLKWEDDKREYLAYLVETAVEHRNYDESSLTKQYRKFCKELLK